MNVGGYVVVATAIIVAAVVGAGIVSTMYNATTTTVTVPETVTETIPVPVTDSGTLDSTEAEALLYMIEGRSSPEMSTHTLPISMGHRYS